jgi:hypothetical protein
LLGNEASANATPDALLDLFSRDHGDTRGDECSLGPVIVPSLSRDGESGLADSPDEVCAWQRRFMWAQCAAISAKAGIDVARQSETTAESVGIGMRWREAGVRCGATVGVVAGCMIRPQYNERNRTKRTKTKAI